MEKNIIVCWNKASASAIQDAFNGINDAANKGIEKIKKQKSDVKKHFESLIKEADDPEQIRLQYIYDKTHGEIRHNPLFVSIMNVFGETNSADNVSKLKAIVEKQENQYKEKLISEITRYKYEICTSFDMLQKRLNEHSQTVDGIIVLCELEWDHEKTNALPTEYAGITLVQQFIRYEKRIKAPVVFTSKDPKETILKTRPDAKIISTTVLQHKFIPFKLSNVKSLLDGFDGMDYMKSDKQLDFTIEQYCGTLGMLRQIKHRSRNCSEEEKQMFREQLRYAIGIEFGSNEDLLRKAENPSTDLEQFSVTLINKLKKQQESKGQKTISDYTCDSREKQIPIIFLEDNEEDDDSNRFVDYIVKKNKEKVANGQLYLFREPVVVRNAVDFFEYFEKLEKEAVPFKVVVCDIEIWTKGELTALGFDVIEEARWQQKSPTLYYIATNVTRDLHSRLKGYYNDGLKDIRLKEDIFATDESIDKFLYGIKEAYQKNSTDLAPLDEYNFCKTFREMYKYVKKVSNYGENIKLKAVKDEASCYYYINNYRDMEDAVRMVSLELIRHFLKESASCYHNDWVSYDKVCTRTRNYIGKFIGLGNNRCEMKTKVVQGEQLNATDIKNIIRRLILRRFFLYGRLFVKHYDIMAQLIKADSSIKDITFYDEDLVCRAISSEYRDGTTNNQSKCLEDPLHYSIEFHCKYDLDDSIQLTEEEKDFVDAIVKKEAAAFDFSSEEKIAQLDFDY